MKKTETLYSYLYKKSNKMWAVKYKFHKKDQDDNQFLIQTLFKKLEEVVKMKKEEKGVTRHTTLLEPWNLINAEENWLIYIKKHS